MRLILQPKNISPHQNSKVRHYTHLVHLVPLAERHGLLEPPVLLVDVRRDAPELQKLVLLDALSQRDLEGRRKQKGEGICQRSIA